MDFWSSSSPLTSLSSLSDDDERRQYLAEDREGEETPSVMPSSRVSSSHPPSTTWGDLLQAVLDQVSPPHGN